jgi:RNA recognition motif-containing protein
MKKLYIGNLPFQTTDQELEQMFSQHGTVASASVITDKMTGRSRGFGFVEMENDEEADAAIKAMDGQDYDGRPLTVNEARPRVER